MVSLAAVPMKHVRTYLRHGKKAKNGKLYNVERAWDKNGRGIKALRMMMPKSDQNKYRLYLPILDSDKPKKLTPLQAVSAAVKEQGYIIEDYIAGIACTPDGKRRRKIGALIASTAPEALKQFVNDDRRSAYKSKHYVVFSAHPYDILGMSTGRRWDRESCMHLPTPENKSAEGGSFRDKMREDIHQGTIVAYVIDNFDVDEATIAELESEWNRGPIQQDKMELLNKLKKQIRDLKNLRAPKGRLLLKPFIDSEDPERVMYKVESTVYGTNVIGFEKAAKRFVDRLNRKLGTYKANGIFRLADNLYDDGVGETHTRFDFDSVEDKIGFYRKYAPLTSDMTWVNADPRWLDVILENDVTYKRLPQHSLVAKLADWIKSVYYVKSTLALQVIEGFLEKQSRDFVSDLAYELLSIKNVKPDVWKTCLKIKPIHDLVREDFEFISVEDARASDNEWIIEHACNYDPRWLLGLSGRVDIYREKDLCDAVVGILKAPIDMEIIKPLIDSDNEVVVDILKGLRLLCELVTYVPRHGMTVKPRSIDNDAVKNAVRFKKLLASDKFRLVCNERNKVVKNHLVNDSICTYMYVRTDTMFPMLADADVNWVFEIPNFETECHIETFNDPKIYERLMVLPRDNTRRNQIIDHVVKSFVDQHRVEERRIRRASPSSHETSDAAAIASINKKFPYIVKIVQLAKKEADEAGLVSFVVEAAVKLIA